jgi:single-strand DNA-binding protein
MYQSITLIGNLGNDPEMRYTPSGVPVASFNLAVNKSHTSEDGQRRDETTWFKVTAWRKQAETVSQYLAKGRQVMVVGEVKASAYNNKAGQPAASLEVTAQTIKFLGGRDGHAANGHEAPGAPVAAHTGADTIDGEEIPF